MKKLLLTFVLACSTVGATQEQSKQKDIWAKHKKKIIAVLVITTTAIACVCDQYFNGGNLTNSVKNKIFGFIGSCKDSWLKARERDAERKRSFEKSQRKFNEICDSVEKIWEVKKPIKEILINNGYIDENDSVHISLDNGSLSNLPLSDKVKQQITKILINNGYIDENDSVNISLGNFYLSVLSRAYYVES